MVKQNRVLIVGGGFAGIQAALDLSKKNLPNTFITLVSDKHHFEYTPLLYRAVTGRNPLEVCVPLRDIFNGKNVAIDIDTVIGITPDQNVAIGASGTTYEFDYAILALGSETIFYGIEGMKDFSFSFKSINEALRLKEHLHKMFEEGKKFTGEEKDSYYRIVIVGGGPSGVELAGELAVYTKNFSKIHKIDKSKIEIVLIEGSDRVLSVLSPKVSDLAIKKLKELNVKVLLGEKVKQVEKEKVLLGDSEIDSKTIVWASGIRPKEFYSTIPNTEKDPKGRVVVDEQLSIKEHENIFVVGDGANTKYSGMAQTAIVDGAFSAEVIASKIQGKTLPKYTPKKVGYSVPVGPRWAIFTYGDISFSGLSAWILRKIIDIRYMTSILPFWKGLIAVKEGARLCESCPTCTKCIKDNNS